MVLSRSDPGSVGSVGVTKVEAESDEEIVPERGQGEAGEEQEEDKMSYPGPDQLQSVMEDSVDLGYRVQQPFGQHRYEREVGRGRRESTDD